MGARLSRFRKGVESSSSSPEITDAKEEAETDEKVKDVETTIATDKDDKTKEPVTLDAQPVDETLQQIDDNPTIETSKEEEEKTDNEKININNEDAVATKENLVDTLAVTESNTEETTVHETTSENDVKSIVGSIVPTVELMSTTEITTTEESLLDISDALIITTGNETTKENNKTVSVEVASSLDAATDEFILTSTEIIEKEVSLIDTETKNETITVNENENIIRYDGESTEMDLNLPAVAAIADPISTSSTEKAEKGVSSVGTLKAITAIDNETVEAVQDMKESNGDVISAEVASSALIFDDINNKFNLDSVKATADAVVLADDGSNKEMQSEHGGESSKLDDDVLLEISSSAVSTSAMAALPDVISNDIINIDYSTDITEASTDTPDQDDWNGKEYVKMDHTEIINTESDEKEAISFKIASSEANTHTDAMMTEVISKDIQKENKENLLEVDSGIIQHFDVFSDKDKVEINTMEDDVLLSETSATALKEVTSVQALNIFVDNDKDEKDKMKELNERQQITEDDVVQTPAADDVMKLNNSSLMDSNPNLEIDDNILLIASDEQEPKNDFSETGTGDVKTTDLFEADSTMQKPLIDDDKENVKDISVIEIVENKISDVTSSDASLVDFSTAIDNIGFTNTDNGTRELEATAIGIQNSSILDESGSQSESKNSKEEGPVENLLDF